MRLLDARLSGFRNLAEARLDFSPGVNLFLGANGQGKSNLLEALNYPALGRSFRGAADRELVNFEAEAARLEIGAEDEEGVETRFACGLGRDGARRLELDGETLSGKRELVGRLTTVVYDPQTVELVRGGPVNRRRFLDSGLSVLDPDYFRHLQDYGRAWRQKMALLRDLRGLRRVDPERRGDLEIWNREMARHAAPLLLARLGYLRELAMSATSLHRTFTGRETELELVYSQSVESGQKDPSKGDLMREISGFFDYILEDEIRRGRSLAGPHADDVIIRLDGRPLRTYGSQGETRSAAIALKLAQGDLVHQRRRVRPVLFFDDIFSELDKDRSRRLQDMTARDHQVFIATARPEDVEGWHPDRTRRWSVSAGRIEIDA